jgi:hypothetical protein
MLNRSAETATYAGDMAKVEISIPEDLLNQISRVADRAGETRDEFLRRLAERGVAESDAESRKELEELIGPSEPMGGNGTQIIREERNRHPRSDPRVRDGE